VHLRRALLLFAIVLGLAALAASVSRPRDDSGPERTSPSTTEAERPPTASPSPDGDSPAVELTFFAGDPESQQIRAGQAATVLVEVEEPGQVEIADLGVSAPAEPETPARFDVFTRETGRHRITFVPAGEEHEQLHVGTLVVTDAL
jgi:hypothetical protein